MTYLTPAEAKEQTCPLISYCVNPVAVQNDGQSAMHDHVACMGPDCKIGWRWEKSAKPDGAARFSTLPLTPTARAKISSTLLDNSPEPTVSDLWEKLPFMRANDWPAPVVEEIESVISGRPIRGFCGHFGKPE